MDERPGDDDPAVIAAAVRVELRAGAEPHCAAGQQAYMKSDMPFLGVRVPEARAVARRIGRDASPETVLAAAGLLWDEATHREERYAAQALLGVAALRGDPDLVPVIEHMVTTGRWWDYTDAVAHRVAELLDADPVPAAALVRAWSIHEDLWLRRLSIIAQLARRDRLDTVLLADVIGVNADDAEFFIRKAIGWALRDAARTFPEWVREFVATPALSPLSLHEATKHL